MQEKKEKLSSVSGAALGTPTRRASEVSSGLTGASGWCAELPCRGNIRGSMCSPGVQRREAEEDRREEGIEERQVIARIKKAVHEGQPFFSLELTQPGPSRARPV